LSKHYATFYCIVDEMYLRTREDVEGIHGFTPIDYFSVICSFQEVYFTSRLKHWTLAVYILQS